MHSIWRAGDTVETLTRITKKVSRTKGLRMYVETMTVQDLDEIADFIADTVYKAHEFALSLYGSLYKPQLSAPLDGSLILTAQPTFSWEEFAGATGYEFVLADNPDFTSPIVSKTLDGTAYLSELELDYSTTYYWKVRAISATFQSLWSDIWSFAPKGG